MKYGPACRKTSEQPRPLFLLLSARYHSKTSLSILTYGESLDSGYYGITLDFSQLSNEVQCHDALDPSQFALSLLYSQLNSVENRDYAKQHL